jgi:hypothetical protein
MKNLRSEKEEHISLYNLDDDLHYNNHEGDTAYKNVAGFYGEYADFEEAPQNAQTTDFLFHSLENDKDRWDEGGSGSPSRRKRGLHLR